MWTRWLLAVALTAAACTEPNPAFEIAGAADAGAGGGSASGGTSGAGGSTPSDTQVADTLPPDPPIADADVVVDADPPIIDVVVPEAAPPDLPGSDAPMSMSDASSVDQAPRDLAPDVFVPPAGCGLGAANIAGIKNADGLAIDTDGTVYFLTDTLNSSWVGRTRPNNQPPEIQWLEIMKSPTTYGLALDSAKERLYVLVVDGTGGLTYFDHIKGTPTGGLLVNAIDNGNDVVVAPDGTVFYNQQGDRNIYSVRDGGQPRIVTVKGGPVGTTTTKPAGLAIAPDGDLVVGLENLGAIFKIKLTPAGLEESRAAIGGTNGWKGWANGLAYDHGGHLYISMYHDTDPRSVVRLEADGVTTTAVRTGGRYSSIAFGRGPLDCRDLYIADPFGPMVIERVPGSL